MDDDGIRSPRHRSFVIVNEGTDSSSLTSRHGKQIRHFPFDRRSRSAFRRSKARAHTRRIHSPGRAVAQLVEQETSSPFTCPCIGPKDRGLSDLTVASSSLAGSSSFTRRAWALAARHRYRSSTANDRARRRRAASHGPTRTGRRGDTTTRCGCESRRSGHFGELVNGIESW